MRNLDDNKNRIESTQNEVNKAERDIDKAKIEIKAEQILFNKRMRVMIRLTMVPMFYHFIVPFLKILS